MGRTGITFRPWTTPTGALTKESIRQYTVNPNLIYYGFSVPGATDSQARWCIQRHTISGKNFLVEFVNGKDLNVNIWNTGSVQVVSGATNANPCAITCTAHGYSTGDKVVIYGVGGMTQINDLQFTITKVNANSFTLDGIDSSAYGAFTTNGSVLKAEFMQFTYS